MPRAETYEFGPLLMSNHASGRDPKIYVEYAPVLRHEYGTVVAAEEFVKALATLPPDEPATRALHPIRDCCGFQPWSSVIERAIWWRRPGEEVVLEIGKNRFTSVEFRRLIEWLVSVPFLDPCHEPHVELDEDVRVKFERLYQRLGVPSPQYAA